MENPLPGTRSKAFLPGGVNWYDELPATWSMRNGVNPRADLTSLICNGKIYTCTPSQLAATNEWAN